MPAVEAIINPKPIGAPLKAKKPARPDEEQPHLCITCGCVYPKQPGYFPFLRTKQYKGNNWYSPICNTCCTQHYQNWFKQYEDEGKAIRRCCEWLNVYYDPDGIDKTTNGIVGYLYDMDKAGHGYWGKTWDNTLEAEKQIVGTFAYNTEADGAERSPAVEEGIKVFGEGYPADAYKDMLRTYHSYIDPLGDTATMAQLENAALLGALKYRAMEAIKNDKSNASALSTTLNKMIKDSGFDVVQAQETGTDEDTFGTWLAEIEELTPAEYVKKHPYKDLDNIDEYMERFVSRPIRNMLSRSSQREVDELEISDAEAYSNDGGDSDGK